MFPLILTEIIHFLIRMRHSISISISLLFLFLTSPAISHAQIGENTPRIEVFARHCYYSPVSQNRQRFPWFSREACHNNLLGTVDKNSVNITFFLDTYFLSSGTHFIKNQTEYPVIEIKAGNEAGAFLKLIDYIASLSLDPETIIYIVEDDYLHRPDWVAILIEGFEIPEISYVTLYDHNDKYFYSMYDQLKSKLYHTKSCHWRVTPSTTNTYAMKFKTLLRDLDFHREYSLNVRSRQIMINFVHLGKKENY